MRIRDWSSDVCSSDLGRSSSRRDRESNGAAAPLRSLRSAWHSCASSPQVAGRFMTRLTPIKMKAPWHRLAVTEADWRREDPTVLIRMLEQLFVIRRFEEKILELHGLGLVHGRSEEHTSELQSLMRISYAVLCLTTKKRKK